MFWFHFLVWSRCELSMEAFPWICRRTPCHSLCQQQHASGRRDSTRNFTSCTQPYAMLLKVTHSSLFSSWRSRCGWGCLMNACTSLTYCGVPKVWTHWKNIIFLWPQRAREGLARQARPLSACTTHWVVWWILRNPMVSVMSWWWCAGCHDRWTTTRCDWQSKWLRGPKKNLKYW